MSDQTHLDSEKPNVARFFVYNRQITWVLLLATVFWGIYAYQDMPKRKDPNIPVRIATAVTPWPGVSAEKIEQLVTQQVEQSIATSSAVEPPSAKSFGIQSLTLPGVSIIQIQLSEDVLDTTKEFNDINLKLDQLNNSLPQGAGPIQFNSGFGETAALLLAVASPTERPVELRIRARDIASGINQLRSAMPSGGDDRVAIVIVLPRSVGPAFANRGLEQFAAFSAERGFGRDPRPFSGPGYVGLDIATDLDDQALDQFVQDFLKNKIGIHNFAPDAWDPMFVRDPENTLTRLTAVAGPKYSYHQLDRFTDLMSRALQVVPQVSKIERSGVLEQQISLFYSQERLAAYGLQPAAINQILAARNTPVPGGQLQVEDASINIEPSGEFTDAAQIGDVIVARSPDGSPVYLRSMVDTYRGYQSPPRFLNYYRTRGPNGEWRRTPAVSLAIQMHEGEQIGEFGTAINQALDEIKATLPEDLIVARVSDQPRQVSENLELFNTALYEAILLVVVVGFIGFLEWRAAMLLMISIPLTLAMTFGMIYMLGVELQQVSVATLIIALGLLVDDPVVASDAIKRELAAGQPRSIAAWLGPTKLAKAILFATITNILAYVPFLLLGGTSGEFVRSLPIVMGCALIASRLVSMSFVPFLGYYLLRPRSKPELSMAERRSRGFTGWYHKVGSFAIEHRKKVFVASLAILVAGGYIKSQLKNSFFPVDVQYLFYVEVWLRNEASLAATNAIAREAERVIRQEAARFYSDKKPDNDDPNEGELESITSYVGGGAPRFWFTVTPELKQQNYAQILVRGYHKDDTAELVDRIQVALSSSIAGARFDVKQIQTNHVQYPVAVRISGQATINSVQEDNDIRNLRQYAAEVVDILRSVPLASRVRDDWGGDSFSVRLEIDSDRANLAGITNQDVAISSAVGISGVEVTNIREGDELIPVVARMRSTERARLSDLQDLYVFSTEDTNKVPLLDIGSVDYNMEVQRIRRLEQFRTVTVFAYPVAGALASEIYEAAQPQLSALASRLPPGYRMEISGEQAQSVQGFKNLTTVMAISATFIFMALVFQFSSAIKPLLVFAAVPYGVVGALLALYIMGSAFDFMAFLGIVSLIGVIVSHVIVLFDFIEEMHKKGEPLRDALLDAGIIRLRPVLITVGATVLALIPLAIHGGPLWHTLCYAQIGGLTVATFVTLILVPVLYSIFVLDLKIIRWEDADQTATRAPLATA